MKQLTKSILIIILLLTILPFSACNQGEGSHTTQIFALDTVIDITAYGENAKDAVSSATKEIHRLEKLFSVTNEESDIYKLNHSDGAEVTVDDETYSLLSLSKKLSSDTEGNFDITIYPMVMLWGFTEKDYRVPSESEIREALKSVNAENLILSKNNSVKLINHAQVDLGGIAKGYIADKAAEIMKNAGCTSGLISLGGNVRTIGTKVSSEPWTVGIQSPDSEGYFATLKADECSIITSGAYQRNFTQDDVTYHHIIDPVTGMPSDSDAVSVTIIGKDGAKCDALSTAIFIGGSNYAEILHRSMPDFEYVVLTKNNKIYACESLKEKFSLSESHSHLQINYR